MAETEAYQASPMAWTCISVELWRLRGLVGFNFWGLKLEVINSLGCHHWTQDWNIASSFLFLVDIIGKAQEFMVCGGSWIEA
jgi:hypothetical protein